MFARWPGLFIRPLWAIWTVSCEREVLAAAVSHAARPIQSTTLTWRREAK